jgi:hypothetical protein
VTKSVSALLSLTSKASDPGLGRLFPEVLWCDSLDWNSRTSIPKLIQVIIAEAAHLSNESGLGARRPHDPDGCLPAYATCDIDHYLPGHFESVENFEVGLCPQWTATVAILKLTHGPVPRSFLEKGSPAKEIESRVFLQQRQQCLERFR